MPWPGQANRPDNGRRMYLKRDSVAQDLGNGGKTANP
jgi:hypothetical protein